jgi:hypothetical protein
MTQCERTVHRAALVPSASPQNPLTNPMAPCDTSFPQEIYQASRDRCGSATITRRSLSPLPPSDRPRARARRIASTGQRQRARDGAQRNKYRHKQATEASVGPRLRARDGARDSAGAARPRRRPRAISMSARMHAPHGQCRAEAAGSLALRSPPHQTAISE